LFTQPLYLFLVLLAELFSPVHSFSLRVLQKVVQLSGIISLEIIFILVPVDFVDDGQLLLLEVAQVEMSGQRLSCDLELIEEGVLGLAEAEDEVFMAFCSLVQHCSHTIQEYQMAVFVLGLTTGLARRLITDK